MTAALLLLLTGCTNWREYVRNGFKVGPDYCPPPAPVAEQWIEANDPNVRSQPPEDEAWWQVFGDPVLNRLIETAYRQNLTLGEAGQRVLEAQAQRGIVVGELFPQSQNAFGGFQQDGLSATTANTPPARFYSEATAGAALAWELDFWGRFRRAVEAADANLDAQIENYDDVLVLLLAQVAESYVDFRTAEQRLEYARKNAEIQRESLRLAELKFGNGATTRLDVTQAQTSLWQTEAFIPPLEALRRRAENSLCILLGMPPQDLSEMLRNQVDGRVIPVAPAQVAVGVPADLLRRRPDVRRAERQVAAQSALIGVAISELYPHFSIAGDLHFDAEHFRDLFAGKSVAGSVGPSFRWDILNYGRLVNGIRVQNARFQQLVFQYQNLVLRANAEAEDALVGFLKAQQAVRSLRKSTAAADESLQLVRMQYKEGKTDFNRVFSIEQALTQQQDQLAVAEGAVANTLVQLYKALGGGWQIRLGSAAEGDETGPSTESTSRQAVPVSPPAR